MRKSKGYWVFGILMVIALYSTLALAEEKEWDYQDIETYQNNYDDFYQNSDPSKWNWVSVDWKNAALQDRLTRDAAASKAYLGHLGCNNCKVEVSSLQVYPGVKPLQYSDKGISYQNSFVSPGKYPSGTAFIATDEGIEVRIPEGVTNLKIPKTDTFLLHTGEPMIEATRRDTSSPWKQNIMRMGRKVTLEDGTTVSGSLFFDKEKVYVKSSAGIAVINGVSIESSGGSGVTRVFFDGKPHPESKISYVSLSTTEKMMTAKAIDAHIYLSFGENNPLFKIEKQDSPVDFRLEQEVQLTVQNRDQEGLIPLVRIRKTGDRSDYHVRSGLVEFEYSGHFDRMEWYPLPPAAYPTSSPMALLLEDKEGVDLFGSTDGKPNFLITNYNELIAMGTLPDTEGTFTRNVIPHERGGSSPDIAPGRYSERLDFNYDAFTIKAFRQDFPRIQLTGAINPTVVKRLSDALHDLPPAVVASVEEIIVYTDEEYEKASPENSGAWTSSDRIMRLKLSTLGESTVYHEAAHDLTFLLQQQKRRQQAQQNYLYGNNVLLDSQLEALTKKYQLEKKPLDKIDELLHASNLPPDARVALQDIAQQFQRNVETMEAYDAQIERSFEYRWIDIAGNVYGKDLGPKTVGGNVFGLGQLSVAWKDGTSGPRNGCVRAYGCNNFFEDVATFVEYADMPSFFTPFTNQDPREARVLRFQTLNEIPLYFRTQLLTNIDVNDVRTTTQTITHWSPDKANWMPLSILTVDTGKFKGYDPEKTTKEIITKLDNNGDASVLYEAAREHKTTVTNAEYDSRYKEKVKLLCGHKFIGVKTCQAILGGTP
ncbi:hypothetical protein HYS48_02640 [Candidatus Woesearchaeota archaeon]|nr:hypothetical protein [Candidatus Woesearchaeota archaeon]